MIVHETIKVVSRSAMVTQNKVVVGALGPATCYWVAEGGEIRPRLQMARVLLPYDELVVPVRLMNTNDEDVQQEKEECLGELCAIQI